MNWNMGCGGMGGWMVVGTIFSLLVVAGFILLMIWGFRQFKGGGKGDDFETPLDILKKRYARGEITREQFEEMKRDLS